MVMREVGLVRASNGERIFDFHWLYTDAYRCPFT